MPDLRFPIPISGRLNVASAAPAEVDRPLRRPGRAVAATRVSLTSATPQGEWRAFGGDLASTHYSAADQITRDNVRNLKVVWRQSLTPDAVKQGRERAAAADHQPDDAADGRRARVLQHRQSAWSRRSTRRPARSSGSIPSSPAVRRLPGRHGAPRIARADAAQAPAEDGPAGGGTRSLAYWTDGSDERIIALVGGRYLVALNAKTGKRYPDFGDGGQVDLRKGQERGVDDVLVAHRADRHRPRRHHHRLGHQRHQQRRAVSHDDDAARRRARHRREDRQAALDVARDSAAGRSRATRRWLNDSWAYTGNVNVWGTMSGDEELGLVYLPETTPTNDWYGGKRPGQQSLRRKHRRARCEDRQARVAFPGRASRPVGLRLSVRADAGRHHA